MKTWKDLSTVPMPLHMRHLPRDARGYPVPWIAASDRNGKVDFRVLDSKKVDQCMGHRVCSLCGKRMEGPVAFVGGPVSMHNRMFLDPPMHKSCAEYALQVCPFLAAPSFAYSRAVPEMEGMTVSVDQSMEETRPEVFGLGLSDRYTFVEIQGHEYIHSYPWQGPVVWYKHGEITQYKSPYEQS